MFLQSSPPLCPASPLSCLTQFPSSSSSSLLLRLVISSSHFSQNNLQRATDQNNIIHHSPSSFYCVYTCACLKFQCFFLFALILKEQHGGRPPSASVLHTTSVRVDASEEDAATLIIIHLVTPVCGKITLGLIKQSSNTLGERMCLPRPTKVSSRALI